MPLLRGWQVLFALLLAGSLLLGFRIGNDITIDTDLSGISPGNRLPAELQGAVDALNGSIEKRVILLISGNDEETVVAAEKIVRDTLSLNQSIQLLPGNDDFTESLLNKIKPYRFSLLTKQQRETLQVTPAVDIARIAHARLFGLSDQVRVFDFSEDPLGWHSSTISDLLGDSVSLGERDQPIAVININIKSGALNMDAQARLRSEFDSLSERVSNKYAVTIDRSGIFFFAAEAAISSKRDIGIISTGSTIGVVLLLLLVFRSARALVLPLVSIGLGVVFAFLITHTLFGKVHILTIVFGASLIGIVIDYSLHYFYHGANTTRTDGKEQIALFRALALSLTTSVIGYAALSFSSLDALKKVALFSCCGLFMAWLSVVCLGRVALRNPLTTEQRVFPLLVRKLSAMIARIPPRLWIGVASLVIVCGTLIATVDQSYSDNPRVFFSAPKSMLASEQRVASVASDFEPGRFVIVHGKSTSDVYQNYAELLSAIDRSPSLTASQFTSLLNWVSTRETQDQNYQAQQLLYRDGGAADRLYQLLGQAEAGSIKQAYTEAASRRLTPEQINSMLGDQFPPMWFQGPQNVVAFALVKKGIDADELGALTTSIDGVEYVNSLQRTQTALAQQRISATQLLLVAYLLVALLMVLRFRRWQAASLVLIPVSATAMLFISAFVFGFSLNLFHIMALFLVLGFGMDYGIFVHEMRDHSQVTLQAILLSAITSLLSFGLLSISAIPVVASFGLTLLVGNLFNLVGAFVYTYAQPIEEL